MWGECVARDFSRAFYRSKAWRHTRDAYARSVNGLCERCLKRGEYRKGEIVHHIVHLSHENIDDPAVTLGFDNLELVCRDCHADVHPEVYGRDQTERRYSFDEDGNLVDRSNDGL